MKHSAVRHAVGHTASHAIRRLFTHGALALSALVCASAAHAAYPEQPIRIIVPYPAGGSTDLTARLLGQKVGEQLGQTVIVENRPGAGSNIGTNYVAKSKPDGYTLILATSTALAVNPSLYSNLPFDPQKDLAPIIMTSTMPNVVVVGTGSKAHTLQELNTMMKGPGGPWSYASAGSGTPSHLGGELYKRALGVPLVHVPYKGGAPALTDLIGGQTTFMIAVMPEAMPLVKDGKLRALAVSTRNRLPGYPDLPTISEAAIPGYELVAWYGILAPAGTPPAIVATLNKAFDKALKEPDVVKKMQDMGFDITGGAPDVLAQRMKTETPIWKDVIDKAGIKMD
ncbi:MULTISPECIES: tripartite tricarboxylate transporter substrate binding protein [unclassified Achromobacter]|uniref:Bug family tripartite tricarboxylate transporter substrate binding protein n=1 Tax=unclassified Achromobacter TaxID=2626865 RepID=UPI000B517C08|nr:MULTISPECIES: tripartite tricarboxylate transporter substrate binding protein [unclassified Achromobacter]OWT74522.1 ABC transporter substrate-binding protein [Achromobacter sp. HZ34]OWT78989.1 ABC transporter substrate-binding protein [Achromobacter sp. HZ28]